MTDREIRIAINLLGNNDVDVGARGRAYREAGWRGFAEDTPAFTPEEMEAERNRNPSSPL